MMKDIFAVHDSFTHVTLDMQERMKSGDACPHSDNNKHVVNTRTALQLSLGINTGYKHWFPGWKSCVWPIYLPQHRLFHSLCNKIRISFSLWHSCVKWQKSFSNHDTLGWQPVPPTIQKCRLMSWEWNTKKRFLQNGPLIQTALNDTRIPKIVLG